MATEQKQTAAPVPVPPVPPTTPILSAHDVVQQAAAAHAAILAPYMSSDSDDETVPITITAPNAANPIPPPSVSAAIPVASSSTCNLTTIPTPPNNSLSKQNININAKITSNGSRTSSHALPPMEPICESANENNGNSPPVSDNQPSNASNNSKSEQVQVPPVKMEDQVVAVDHQPQPGTDVLISEDGVSKTADGDNASANNTKNNNCVKSENALDPAVSTDTINVSRSCLDSVLEQMANRISELENIRERKKQRVERLSSVAMMAQTGTTPMWTQSAALAAAQAAVAANPTAINPVNPINSLAAAAASNVNVNPPPPPPPPPDGGERKQSRYWTADEHERFLAAIKTCGPKNYVRIAELVGTRNAKQVRTHAQKFQKKLEREEARRQEDIRRHGGTATSVSAAAVAAVAAAAAAMHQNGHLSAADAAAAPVLGAYAVQHPHLLLPYNHPTMAARTNSLLAMYAGSQAAQHHHVTPHGVPPPHIPPLPHAHPVMVSQPQAQNHPITTQIHVQSHTPAAPPDQNVVPVVVDGTSSSQPGNEPPVAPEAVAAAVAAEVAALGRSVYSGKSNAIAPATPTVPTVTPLVAPEANAPAIVNAESGAGAGRNETKGTGSKQGE